MKTVDQGDLAERTRSVEHHHEADWTARPATNICRQLRKKKMKKRKKTHTKGFIHIYSVFDARDDRVITPPSPLHLNKQADK